MIKKKEEGEKQEKEQKEEGEKQEKEQEKECRDQVHAGPLASVGRGDCGGRDCIIDQFPLVRLPCAGARQCVGRGLQGMDAYVRREGWTPT